MLLCHVLLAVLPILTAFQYATAHDLVTNSIDLDSIQQLSAGQTLQSCLTAAGLPVVSPELSDDVTYYAASASDNLIFHYNPTAITYPSSAHEVQLAVRCAAQHPQIAVAARSGGHSFAGYGSGGMDGSLIIDLANMSSIVSDPERGTVQVEPGARLGDIVKGLWHQRDGKRAMATGTCAAVGIGGLSLCGGFGPMSRKWGFTTDNILEADIVLANGTLITASETQNTDIMWALRGSGSFFGIVTRFVFRTHDASFPVSYFEYRWAPSLTEVDTAAKVMSAIQAFGIASDLPTEVGFHMQLQAPTKFDPQPSVGKPLAIHMRGIYLGPIPEWGGKLKKKLFDELHRHSAPKPDFQGDEEGTYLQLMEVWDDFGKPGEKLDTEYEHKQHNNYVTKSSITLDAKKGFTPDALRILLDFIWETSPNAGHHALLADGKQALWGWNIYMELLGGGDPIYRQQEKRQLSSFAHRDGLWLIQVAVGTLPDMTLAHSGHTYAKSLDARIDLAMAASHIQKASYSCYVDADLGEDEWKRLYYGPSLKRLEDLKMQLDPHNLFRNPQSLGTKEEIEMRRSSGQIVFSSAAGRQQNGLEGYGSRVQISQRRRKRW